MNLFLVFLIFISLINSKIFLKKFNKKYLEKNSTDSVKGIFILIVFCSHIKQYISFNNPKLDLFMSEKIVYSLGQMMVAMFLFYSGYGIYESIKNKKNYIKNFPKKRIIRTLLNFDFCVLIYLIIYLVLKNKFSLSRLFLSLIGWMGFGNSNWYVFCILGLYILTYLSFKIFKENKKSIICLFLLISIFYIFLKFTQPGYWRNTLFCYYFGIIYSYNKTNIERFLMCNFKYIITMLTLLICFNYLFEIKYVDVIYYDFIAIVFVIIVLMVTMKLNLNSPILKWFGKNLFWVYILQRIPMIIIKEMGYHIYKYKYFLICFILTIVLTICIKILYQFIENLFFNMHKKTLLRK